MLLVDYHSLVAELDDELALPNQALVQMLTWRVVKRPEFEGFQSGTQQSRRHLPFC